MNSSSDATFSPTDAGIAYPSSGRANFALAVLLLAYIFSFIDRQVLSLLVEPMKQDLNIGDFEVSLLQGMAFAVFYTFMGIPIAKLADTRNRKTIITIGIAVWSLMTFFCGLAKSFTGLFLARIGVGVGEAALSPAAYSMLADYFPPRKLPRAMAIFTMGISIGGGLAYVIGGAVLDTIAGSWLAELPVLKTMRPWQLTFVVVGLPGLLIALLMIAVREPLRQGSNGANAVSHSDNSFRKTLEFVGENRRSYLALFLGISLLSVFGYGLMAWYPSLFIRTYGLSASEVGLKFGVIYLVFGSLGALGGAWFAQRLARRGHVDANLRWPVYASVLMMLPGIFVPLLGSAELMFWACMPLIFIQNSYFGVSLAALQLVTPNHMRAQVGALLLFLTNLIGMTFGPSVVAALTDFVFHDPMMLRYSLSIVAAIFCPLAAMVFASGLRHYRGMTESSAR
ncbi:MAG: spinster family MFS transporter [Pseudomonadales bacterium]